MKKLFAVLLVIAMVTACVVVLTACKNEGIVIWVGEESQSYYQEVLNKYVEDYNASGKKFPHKITVKGIDSSTAAEAVIKDPQAGPAIFTVPHDNLGKLIGTNPIIAAITDKDLLAQIENDNPDGYKKVIKNTVGGQELTFAVPYIGQALVLYYNTDKINGEQVKTWEGIMEAASAAGKVTINGKAVDVKATTVMGNDSYNLSFFMLARQLPENKTSVKIYEGADINAMLKGCHCTGDDTMASFKWAQRFFNDDHGGALAGSDKFETLLQNGQVLSLVGGAWKYNGVKAALGSKLGIAQLPTYTITADDAYGTITAGTTFKSGTFADCKVLCINGMNKIASKDKALLEDIIKYMSSKEIQEGSFEKCNNLPAYKNASMEFEAMKSDSTEALLAQKQIEMAEWGMPQPFGYHNFLNLFFYQKGADTYTQEILMKRDSAKENASRYTTDESLKEGLQIIENIWMTGKATAE